MVPVRKALLQSIAEDPELQNLPLAVGAAPSRPPPSLNAISRARRNVAKALGISAESAEKKHRAGKWRYRLVEAVQKRADDPDPPTPKVAQAWSTDRDPRAYHAGQAVPAMPLPGGARVPRRFAMG